MMSLIKRFKRVHIIVPAIIVCSLIMVQIAQAVTTGEPGTDSDPLVTQSYVDEKISELTTKVNELTTKVNDLTAKEKSLTESVTSLTATNDELTGIVDGLMKKVDENEKATLFEVLELKKDQQLILGASAEIILRGGKATAIASTSGGLSDITAGTGKDVLTGQQVPLNHLLLISRDDGRGLKVTTEKAWILVKGKYSIK